MRCLLRRRLVVVALFVAALSIRSAALAHAHEESDDEQFWQCTVCGCNNIYFDPEHHGAVCDYMLGWWWHCSFRWVHDCEASSVIIGG